MISLLTCCTTQQSSEQTCTKMATDTATIYRVAANDSTSTQAKIDSIIIEEYNQDDEDVTECVSQKEQRGYISTCQKRNDISQNKFKTPTKKIKIYGVKVADTRIANRDALNKQTAHQEKTVSQVKQKTPTKSAARGKIIYVIIGITLLLFIGYLNWKNAVQ